MLTRKIKAFPTTVLLLPVLLAACGQETGQSTVVADIKTGGQLFAKNCARCHGQQAKGTDQGPPLVNPIYKPGHHSDAAFYRAIAQGSQQHHWNFGNMPPVSGVSRDEATHIIAYVRSLQVKAGIK